MASIVLPGPLRQLTGAPATLAVDATTAGEALRELERRHPNVVGWVLDESGRLREHIKLFVGECEATLDTPLPEGGELYVVRAISGGLGSVAGASLRSPALRSRRTR